MNDSLAILVDPPVISSGDLAHDTFQDFHSIFSPKDPVANGGKRLDITGFEGSNYFCKGLGII